MTIKNLDFPALVTRILNLLTDKERDIIQRRFALLAEKKETLDRIGKSYSITRERVRQIEEVAIQKLTRISKDPSMKQVHDLACSILEYSGGVMLEDLLVSKMLKNLEHSKLISLNSIKFAMRVSTKLVKQEKNQMFKAFWYLKDISILKIRSALTDTIKLLKNNGDTLSFEEIHNAVKSNYDANMLKSIMDVSSDLMKHEGKWGLTEWRFINPRSIKDYINIVLKNEGNPMHFRAIMKKIKEDFVKHKSVTSQASHNELIRHDEFVLLGRGIYGLRQWGLCAGTVCDLIVAVLKENGGIMKRQDIINAVMEKRDVRIGTISLNLQKYPFFVRLGRAVYKYDKAKDNRKRRKYSDLS